MVARLALPGGRRGRAYSQDRRRVSGHLDRVRPVGLVAEAIGEVLEESPAAGHVEDVQAAAYGEKRKIGIDRCPRQDQLEPVPPVVGQVRLLVRRLVVQRGVDVPPAGQHQAVEPGDQHGHRTRRDGRQYDRRSPRALDGSRVAHRRDNGLAIKLPHRAASSSPVMPMIGRPIRPPAHKVPVPIMVHHAPAGPAHRKNLRRRLIPTRRKSIVTFCFQCDTESLPMSADDESPRIKLKEFLPAKRPRRCATPILHRSHSGCSGRPLMRQ